MEGDQPGAGIVDRTWCESVAQMSRLLPPALIALLVLLVAGCGSGGSPSSGTSAAAETPLSPAQRMKATAKATHEAEARAPKGASPTLRGIYRSFEPPDTGSLEPEAAGAVEAGEDACRGETPKAVKEEFYAEAEGSLEPAQAKMIGRLAKFEARERTDESFVAGQLAADTYAATLPEELRPPGYQGCVYSLALALEQRLAPKQAKK